MKNFFKGRKKGFTLTEVLVVVLIIGVLSAIVYPVYTKAINKSRAVEAMNLLEMVRNKQISNRARNGAYFADFTNMGQLTSNPSQEMVQGNKMTVGKYELAIYPDGSCMTSAYIPAKGKNPIFTFSSGYETAGLGCEGDICSTFGNIVGGRESVCNCGDKNCGANFNMDPVNCSCSCPLECNQNNLCYNKTQSQFTSQSCGNGGTQTRTCTASCDGGSCTAWGPCTGQTCDNSSKPAATQNCVSGCGTQSRTVTCNEGSWTTGSWTGSCSAPTQTQATSQNCGSGGTQTRTCTASCGGGTCGAWGACTGETKACPDNTKPSDTEPCTNCGNRTRTVTCDTSTGNWTTGAWGSCSGNAEETQACTSGSGNETRKCVNNVWQNWDTSACQITCSSDTCWNGTECKEKPAPYTSCSLCLYNCNYVCETGSGWKCERSYYATCSNTHFPANGGKDCLPCTTFKRTSRSTNRQTFPSLGEAQAYIRNNDTCDGGTGTYSGACTGASTCTDLVLSSDSNSFSISGGRWYETGEVLSATSYNNLHMLSDATTCSLYNDPTWKNTPAGACARKWGTPSSAGEKRSTCYQNCRNYSGSGYYAQYTCDINILICDVTASYAVWTYESKCEMNCN